MKSFFFAFSWLLLSAGVILTSVASIQFYTYGQEMPWRQWLGMDAYPNSVPVLSEKEQQEHMIMLIETRDARAQLVANFLERHSSPLQPYDYWGKTLVEIADKHTIDFRLLPAIAMQESNLCKVIPEGSHNCLGLGIHARGTWGFERFEDNFDAAARILKRNYIDQGLVTPEQIMRKYTPSSNGSWAASVNQWMAEMRFDDRSLGRTKKGDADLLEFVDDPPPTPVATPSITPTQN